MKKAVFIVGFLFSQMLSGYAQVADSSIVATLKRDKKVLLLSNGRLKRKVNFLKKQNSLLGREVVGLRRDTADLRRDTTEIRTSLRFSLMDNQRLTAAYNGRINALQGEMKGLGDSLSALGNLKKEVARLYGVLSEINLAYRTYNLPLDILLPQIKTYIATNASDYTLLNSTGSRIFLLESFITTKPRRLIGETKINIQATCRISFRESPIDKKRTLVDLQIELQNQDKLLFDPTLDARVKEKVGRFIDKYVSNYLSNN